MDIIKRIVGVVLIIAAVVLAVHTVVEPLYFDSSTTGSGYNESVWALINSLSAFAVVLGVAFGYARIRKSGIRRRRGGHPRVPGCQYTVLRSPVPGYPVLLQLVQPSQFRFQCGGSRRGRIGMDSHRRRPSAYLVPYGTASAEGRFLIPWMFRRGASPSPYQVRGRL